MDENHLSQLREIIGALSARTRQDKVEWVWDDLWRNLTTTLASGKVTLEKDRDLDTVIKIVDTYGNVLEEVNAGFKIYVDLKEDADALYDLARRSALQIDSKLESILREISA